jgi:hypothetical protein
MGYSLPRAPEKGWAALQRNSKVKKHWEGSCAESPSVYWELGKVSAERVK